MHPAEDVVLAVCVVVALLGFAAFVAGRDHRDSAREQQGAHQVAHRFAALLLHKRIRWFALDAVVERVVVARAVAVAFAVGLIVLDVVTDQVVQGEAIVCGDEVHGAQGSGSAIDHIA